MIKLCGAENTNFSVVMVVKIVVQPISPHDLTIFYELSLQVSILKKNMSI